MKHCLVDNKVLSTDKLKVRSVVRYESMDETPIRFSIVTRSRSRQGSTEEELTPTSLEELGQRISLSDLEEGSSSGSTSESIVGEDGVQEPDNNLEAEVRALNDMAEARGPLITPKKFGGGVQENVEEYVAQFERIARANGWDAAKKLVVLPCYLEGAALKWLENLEQAQGAALTWDIVKEKIKEAFQSIAWEEQLEFKLRMRMQGEEEPVEAYLQDVLNLCSKLDPQMVERCKIKHVLRGLKPSLLEKVMVMANDTLDNLLANIRKIQTARYMAGQRVDQLMAEPCTRTMQQLTPVTTTPPVNTSALESKIESLTSEFAKFSVHLMGQRGRGETSHRGASRGRPEHQDRQPYDRRDSQDQRGRGALRGSNRGRTADGRIICYKCNRVGHYAINCRSDWNTNPGNEQGGR